MDFDIDHVIKTYNKVSGRLFYIEEFRYNENIHGIEVKNSKIENQNIRSVDADVLLFSLMPVELTLKNCVISDQVDWFNKNNDCGIKIKFVDCVIG